MPHVDTHKLVRNGCKRTRFAARHAVTAATLPMLLYSFFCAFAYLLNESGVSERLCLAVIHAGGAASLLACWKLARFGLAKFGSFGAALLLVAAAFRLHAMLDTLAYGTRLDEIYQYVTLYVPDPPFPLLLKGEFVTVLGMILISCGWRLAIGSKVEHHTVEYGAHRVPIKLAWFVYAAAVSVDVAQRILHLPLGPFQQMASLLFGFGVAAIYFIAKRAPTRWHQVLLAGLLGAPLTALALNSGMKSELFFPLIPSVVLCWTCFRSNGARAALLAGGIAVLSISQLYVFYVRDMTWRPGGDLSIRTDALTEGFVSQFDDAKMDDALDSTSARVNLTISHAISVLLADQDGFVPTEVFGLIPASLVPRIFWPGKPVIQPGAMQTRRILGRDIPLSQIRSATAPGFLTEFYLGGGWPAAIFGPALYGLLVAGAQKWSLRRTPEFGHPALCFLALYWTLRLDENQVVYAFTAIIFTVTFLWMLRRATRLLGLPARPLTQ